MPQRHQVQRIKDRARYEPDAIHRILDAHWLAHVGFEQDGQVFVIPMLYARDGHSLILHGSIASRLQKFLGGGAPACVTVTLVDGLVLARSHFHHSANYRSVVAFGTARLLEDEAEKRSALIRLVEHMMPGRAAESREADRNELNATAVLRFEIEDASAKVRAAGVKDDREDIHPDVWAGVLPLGLRPGEPIKDAHVAAGTPVPKAVQAWIAANTGSSSASNEIDQRGERTLPGEASIPCGSPGT